MINKNIKTLYFTKFNSKLGELSALADDNHLYLLKFSDSFSDNCSNSDLDNYINKLENQLKCKINIDHLVSEIHHSKIILYNTKQQITDYLAGKLNKFTIPLYFSGTEFQNQVWKNLITIPHGNTISYSMLASKVNKPKAFRAVAKANSTNKIVIIIPCHRVINSNGNLGGYSDKIARKKYLIKHERSINLPM